MEGARAHARVRLALIVIQPSRYWRRCCSKSVSFDLDCSCLGQLCSHFLLQLTQGPAQYHHVKVRAVLKLQVRLSVYDQLFGRCYTAQQCTTRTFAILSEFANCLMLATLHVKRSLPWVIGWTSMDLGLQLAGRVGGSIGVARCCGRLKVHLPAIIQILPGVTVSHSILLFMQRPS